VDALRTELFSGTVAVWALLEVSLRVRDRARGMGGADRDAGTRVLIAAAIGGAVVSSAGAPVIVPSLRIPGDGWNTVAGLIFMWLGLGIRVWAVASLGHAFRTTVEVDADQAVVTRGPYRWVRHPAYTGLLVFVVGFGLGANNWLALPICILLPTVALLRRISVEEAELTRVLGDRYKSYRSGTKRLIPGVW
jgi:protein-S-isoprenylcysteine O-methyltransferase Ste14